MTVTLFSNSDDYQDRNIFDSLPYNELVTSHISMWFILHNLAVSINNTAYTNHGIINYPLQEYFAKVDASL